MRQTCEIIADIKDGKEVPYEELRLACLVQSHIIHFFKQDTKALLKGGMVADLKKKMEYSDPKTSSQELGTPSWYWKAIKADPEKYLGDRWTPGTEEWKKMHSVNEKILETVMKKIESQKQ